MKKFYADYLRFAQQLANERGGNVFMEDRMEKDQISVTPYIYNACSANCQFCSELLVRSGSVTVCNGICADYAEKFRKVLERIKETPIFLSLSGKEPTESKEQLGIILDIAKRFQEEGGHITEKVMYSNLSGFAKDYNGLIETLKGHQITRIECSRHHYDEEKNQWIVRFKKNAGEIEPIKRNEVFTDVVKRLNEVIPVRMVAVLQGKGIHNVEEIIEYLKFAEAMGVTDVVFRELAMFDEIVDHGKTRQYIEENRIELMDILEALPDEQFRLDNIIKGYYYFSFGYKYAGNINVSFEMSDYEEMIKYHGNMDDKKIYKLIYYPNGILCKDWNMKGKLDWV